MTSGASSAKEGMNLSAEQIKDLLSPLFCRNMPETARNPSLQIPQVRYKINLKGSLIREKLVTFENCMSLLVIIFQIGKLS